MIQVNESLSFMLGKLSFPILFVCVYACVCATGAAAVDALDVDLSSSIVTSGDVPIPIDSPGVYTIFYDVSDFAGVPAQTRKRVIQVKDDGDCDIEPPVITVVGQQKYTKVCGQEGRW